MTSRRDRGDVTHSGHLDHLFRTTAERLGPIDVLAANAGGINFTPLGRTSEDDFDRASDLNFKAVFFTVQAALDHLSDGASVIVTGNAMASTPVVGPSVAIAGRAAAKALAATLAVEVAPQSSSPATTRRWSQAPISTSVEASAWAGFPRRTADAARAVHHLPGDIFEL